MRSMSTPALRRLVQRLDHRGVHERVDLEHDPGRVAGPRVGGLALDHLDEPRAHGHRRDEEAAEDALARQAGEDVEQVRDVRAKLLATGQQPEVRVQAGGLAVVVARCRCGRSGAGRCPRAGRRAPPWSAS